MEQTQNLKNDFSDFLNYQPEEYQLPEPGVYTAKFFDSKFYEAKEGKNPSVSLAWKLVPSGSILWQNFSFSDSTKKWVQWQLCGVLGLHKHIAITPSDYNELAKCFYEATFKLDKEMLLDVQVTHDTYNGKKQAKIKLLSTQQNTVFDNTENVQALNNDEIPF